MERVDTSAGKASVTSRVKGRLRFALSFGLRPADRLKAKARVKTPAFVYYVLLYSNSVYTVAVYFQNGISTYPALVLRTSRA